MPPTGPDSSDGPDVFEALRGMAHLSDFARKMLGDTDPQMRKQVEMLGDANVKDVVEAVGDQLNSETPTPHLDMRDTDYGLDVLIDCSETPVNASNLTTVYDETDLTLMEPQTGWEASATTDAPIQNVDVTPSDADLVTVEVTFEGETQDRDRSMVDADSSVGTGRNTDTETESPSPSPPMTDDHTPTEESDAQLPDNIMAVLADLDTSQTLNEALADNPQLKTAAKELLGDPEFTMARTLVGDTPIQDIPFEDYLPDDMDIPDELDALDAADETSPTDLSESTDFEFDSDPLSNGDDE